MTYKHIAGDIKPDVADISAYTSEAVIEAITAGKLDPLEVAQFESRHRRRPTLLNQLESTMHRLTAQEVGDMVRAHLDDAEPLSVIRLGDGESRLLGWPDSSARPLVMSQMQYWFGRMDFDDVALAKMAEGLREAVRAADVLGVPRRDQVAGNPDYARVMNYVRHYRLAEGAAYTNASLHRELQVAGWYAEVLGDLGWVTIVTCRDVARRLADAYGVRVAWVPIPEEANTGRQPTDHWPERFRQVREILAHTGPGELVLVGAGLLGKAYCQFVKEAGGVALDVGSVFDGWAGVVSRSYIAEDVVSYRL